MRQHLVAGPERRDARPDGGDDTGRLDAERQRRPPADVPTADADDVVPVADPGCDDRDDELVGRRRTGRRELEHPHRFAERIDPGRSHRGIVRAHRIELIVRCTSDLFYKSQTSDIQERPFCGVSKERRRHYALRE
jgi:hypothetical protein